MSDTLLATKVHVPPLHGNLVNRASLVTRLNDGVARGWTQDAGDAAQDRGLPGSVGSHEPHHLARMHREADALNGQEFSLTADY